MQGVQYCNRLFAIEDSINKKHSGDYEKRKQLRLEKEKPVLEAFWSWLDQQKPVRNTRMDKAVNYGKSYFSHDDLEKVRMDFMSFASHIL